MFSFFRRRHPRANSPAQRAQHKPSAAAPMLETLEDRTLLSAPALAYSSYLPGIAYAVAADSAGDVFATGINGGAYVARLNVNASGAYQLGYLDYLGGGWGTGIAVNSSGDAYVTGEGGPTPTTGAAFTSTGPCFLSELGPTGTLLASTELPDVQGQPVITGGIKGPSVALSTSGEVYVTGAATSGFPVTPGAYQSAYPGGNTSAFLAVFNSSLSGLLYGSYLGGSSSYNTATSVAVDSSGNAYITGFTFSSNFPVTSGAYQTTFGGGPDDAFIAKFDPALSGSASLVWSTYLGGSGRDGSVSDNPSVLAPGQTGPGIAVDSADDVYVTGSTESSNFPTTPGAFQTRQPATVGTNYNDTTDTYVTKLNATGTALIYSTYLGGNNLDGGSSIAVDGAGNATITGWTLSTNFPTLNPIQAQKASGTDGWGNINSDVFLTTLNPSGSALLFSTYLGGTGDDYGFGLALDSAGNAYVAGETLSTNFPTTAGAYETTPGGGFVFKVTPAVAEGSFAVSGFPTITTAGEPQTVTVTALNPNGTVDTGYTGTVTLSSSDPHAVLPPSFTLTNGVATVLVTLDTAGSQSISATDSADSLFGTEGGIMVTPAAVSTLEVSGFPSPTNVGLAGNVTVTALDPYGNVATGYTDSVTLTNVAANVTSTLGTFAFTPADAGVLTTSVALPYAGTGETLTATDTTTPTLTGTQSSITVDPAGVAVRLSITGFPATATAGVAQTITVTALTASGAVAGSYRGTVQFSSSDVLAGLPANYTFTNLDQGVHTFTVILEKAGTQSITITDTTTSSITGSETGITVQSAAAAQFVLSGPAKVTKGVAFSLVLTVEDAYGNVVTGYTGTVHFTSSDSTATLPANYTFTAANAGVHTFAGVELKKSGTKTITVTDTKDSALTATDSFDVLS